METIIVLFTISDIFQTDISGIKHLIQETLERKQSISERYDSYYTGVQTDWDKVFDALMYAKELKDFIEKVIWLMLVKSEQLMAIMVSICSFLNQKFLQNR